MIKEVNDRTSGEKWENIETNKMLFSTNFPYFRLLGMIWRFVSSGLSWKDFQVECYLLHCGILTHIWSDCRQHECSTFLSESQLRTLSWLKIFQLQISPRRCCDFTNWRGIGRTTFEVFSKRSVPLFQCGRGCVWTLFIGTAVYVSAYMRQSWVN